MITINKKKSNSRMISFRMSESYIDLLAELAGQTGRSKSEVLRQGLDLFKYHNKHVKRDV